MEGMTKDRKEGQESENRQEKVSGQEPENGQEKASGQKVKELFALFKNQIGKPAEGKEKREAEKRRGKRERGSLGQREIMRRVLWTGFFCMLCFNLIGMIRMFTLKSAVEEKQLEMGKEMREEIQEVRASIKAGEGEKVLNTEGAKLYVKDFLREFYTWGNSEERCEEREERLEPYFAEGLPADGGYDVSRLDTAGRMESCEIWELVTEEDTIKVTAKTTYVLTREEGAEGKKEEKKEVYVKVVLAAAKEGFQVKDLPFMVQAPQDGSYVLEPETDPGFLVSEEETKQEIHDFMETFFKMSATATKEELKNYTAAEVDSLYGLYAFVKMDDLTVYETETGYQVFADLRLQDLLTKAETILKTECSLKKEKDHLVVESLAY